jgi:hypothetical protein
MRGRLALPPLPVLGEDRGVLREVARPAIRR